MQQAILAVPERRTDDAVLHDDDLLRRIALLDKPAFDRFGIDDDPIGEAAGHPVHRALIGRPDFTRVSDRSQDDRHASQPGSRDGKHIGVKIIGVHDIDAMTFQV
jgi:hypothetical protein